jgi:hypothetical protein
MSPKPLMSESFNFYDSLHCGAIPDKKTRFLKVFQNYLFSPFTCV